MKRFMRKKYNVSDMTFRALTPSFVADFDYYLRVELRFASETIVNTIGQLRRIVKMAINNGLIRNDPFAGYEYITQPIILKSLTAEELDKLINAKLSRPNLNFIRDMFLFSSFTGIAFSDMRMTQHEIAAMFDVYVQTVNANIKAVLKSGIIKAEDFLPATVSGKTIIPDMYGLEMINALSFRIKSKNAEVFRKWLLRKLYKSEIPEMLMMSIQNLILN